MRSFCNYGDLELSRSSELKAKMRRINYEIQATADTRSTNGAVVSALACHQGDPGSNPSGGSLGRMLTMGTDERQESCTDDGYNPERALSTDACKNDGILTSQVEQKSKREKDVITHSFFSKWQQSINNFIWNMKNNQYWTRLQTMNNNIKTKTCFFWVFLLC